MRAQQNSPFSPPLRRTDGSFRLGDPFWDPTAREDFQAGSDSHSAKVISQFLTGIVAGVGISLVARRRR